MRIIRLACLFAIAISATAGAQQKVAFYHGVSPTVSLRFFAPVSSLRVIGWDRDSVELTGVIPASAKQFLYNGGPEERPSGMKMFIEGASDQSAQEGKLVLRVPRGARVWLKTGSAEMDVTGVTGGLDLNVVGGSITVHGNPRELRAESMDGNVMIDGAPEWLRAKTATGDITIKGGRDINASTISGAIHTSGEPVERLKLETTTGAIVFASALMSAATVELETHSGPIDLLLPVRGPAEVDAATITGAIDNQWTRQRPVPGRENRGMTLMAAAGMGSSRITVRTFKGTIQLRPKE